MKMVASAKLHRAQAAIANMLPYESKLTEMLSAFLGGEMHIQSPYTEEREVKRVAIVAFSSNSSLCGAYNSNVASRLNAVVLDYSNLSAENVIIYPIGKKVAEFAQKKGMNIQGNYEHLADKPSFADCKVIAGELMQKFANKEIDKVEIVYHHLKSTSVQLLQRELYLPVSLDSMHNGEMTGTNAVHDYIVEPSVEELLATLVPQAIALKLFTALLDANASEHSARMLAMQVATDNANDLLQELTLMYNKSRQQAITNELLDIVGGSMK